MAGDMTVAQYLRRDVAPLGWIIGNLLLWAVIAIGGVTTMPIWFLIGVPAVPVAIGHVCAYILAQERAPDSIPGAPTN